MANEITYDEIINLIRNELLEVMEAKYSYYKDYNIIISREQEFIKLKQIAPNKIYITLKFSAASVNFGQKVLPVSITALSEQNHLEVCQNLLFDFVDAFNLDRSPDRKIQQIFDSPIVTGNFNEAFEGYRSIMRVSAYFVISENANNFEYKYYNNESSVISSVKVYVKGVDDNEYVLVKTYDKDIEINECFNDKEQFFTHVRELINLERAEPLSVITPENTNARGVYIITKETEITPINAEYEPYNNNPGTGDWEDNNIGFNANNIDLEDYSIKSSIIPDGAVSFKIEIDVDWQKSDIPYLSESIGTNFALDSEAFYNNDDYTISEARYGSTSFAISTYFLDNIPVVDKILDMQFKLRPVNTVFWLSIEIWSSNKTRRMLDKFKIVNVNEQLQLGGIPMISISFTH